MRAPAAGALATAAFALAPAAQAAPLRVYTGTSSINSKVELRASSKQVRSFVINYVAPCDNGETVRGRFRFKPIRMSSDGRFSVKGPSNGVLPDARATASRLRLAGRVTRRKAVGAFTIVTQTAKLDRTGVTTCRSGRIAWTAARQSR